MQCSIPVQNSVKKMFILQNKKVLYILYINLEFVSSETKTFEL